MASTWHQLLGKTSWSVGRKPGKISLIQVASVSSRWKRRWTIVALCFFAFMLCNMDRVNMSIAVLPMSKQFGWDTQTIGVVQSSFFW